MEINTNSFNKQLVVELERIRSSIADDYLAYTDDEEPGIQVTLGCTDSGNEYAIQTGDNSDTGPVYSFPHWAVNAVYRSSDCGEIASDLIEQLNELISQGA